MTKRLYRGRLEVEAAKAAAEKEYVVAPGQETDTEVPFDEMTLEKYKAALRRLPPLPNVTLGRTGRRHLVIPDTQMKPGADNRIMRWLGAYAVDQKPDVIVHLGDHWDMPSLNSWDAKGSRQTENRRYALDIWAGNLGMDIFMAEIRRGMREDPTWKPELVFLIGNHENRIERWKNAEPALGNTIGFHHFNLKAHGWKVHGFLKPVVIDGIKYQHFFPRAASGRVLQTKHGQANARIQSQRERMSCTAGHAQGLDVSIHNAGEIVHRAVIAGSCYTHAEGYMSAGEGNAHWRGCLLKNEVRNGNYDLTEVSIHYLHDKYEKGQKERPRGRRS